ncbi:dehydrogenase [Candidatus Scalindua japonica]|uniref:Dehydrogenase n=2 Tax=Candidatus Scalindua japonica TaxID=1284222 RepID=A0A286TU89_9BACT|nr:dehydrogenase [Candidatus Scalindua japonica]
MPAAIITEQQFPTLERVASIRWGNGGLGENATDWIHLFAKTIFLFIIVPRCFLSVIAFIRERHLRTHFPIQYDKDSYFTKLFISKPGQRELMHIIPYSIELTDQQKDVLRSLFAQVLGWKAQVEFHRTISYGREDQFCREFTFSAKDPVESLAILFSLSSTPETEIHNAFISTLFKMVTDNNMVVQILIVVDESDFKTRFSRQKGAEEKLESRRELWRRTITSKNVKPVFVNLHNPDTNEWQNAINLT